MYVTRSPAPNDKENTSSDEEREGSPPAAGVFTRAMAEKEKQDMLQAPTGGSVSDVMGRPPGTRARTRLQDKTEQGKKGEAKTVPQGGRGQANGSPAKAVHGQARAHATGRASGRGCGRGAGAGRRLSALPAVEEEDEDKDSEEDNHPQPKKVAKHGHGQKRK